jgi:preprotein translocase SecE subunit
MAVAVKNTPEVGSTRSALDRLGVVSLLGTVYALGSIGIVFYLIPSLWWSAWPAHTAGAGALLGLVMLAVAATLAALGVRIFRTHSGTGARAGVFVGLLGFLIVLLLTRWASMWVEHWVYDDRMFGTNGPLVGSVISGAIGVALLLLGARWFLRPSTERALVGFEEQGWFTAHAFKPLQGVRVRRGTIFGILVVAGAGIYTLIAHHTLQRGSSDWSLIVPFTGEVTVTDPGDARPILDKDYPGRDYADPATAVKIVDPGASDALEKGELISKADFDKIVAGLKKEGKELPTAEPPNALVLSRYTLRDINEEIDPATHVHIQLPYDSPWEPGTIVTRSKLDEEIKKLKAEGLTPPTYRPTQPASGKVTFATLTLLPAIPITVPLLLSALALWFAWRVVNLPVFADFLIATEAEMNKVSWTTQRRLVQDTIVVLVTVILMTAFLFTMDQVWRVVLSWKPIGVLQIPEEKPEANPNVDLRPY